MMSRSQKTLLTALQDKHCKKYQAAKSPLEKAEQAYILAKLSECHALENCLFNQRALDVSLAVANRYSVEADKVSFSDARLENLQTLCESYEQLLTGQN